MSFPPYINFQVNKTGGGRSIMDVHSHASGFCLQDSRSKNGSLLLIELSVGGYVCDTFSKCLHTFIYLKETPD